MTEKDLFLKRMEFEFPVTLKVLRAIPSDKSDFKPHERSQSALRIVQTMIGEMRGMENMIKDEETVFSPPEVSSLEEAINMYAESYNQTMEAVKNTSEEDLEKPLEGMMGKFFSRRMDGIWMFLNDSIHHRGQLSVYIRLAGGKVPAIYGASADDNPFAKMA